MEIAAVTDVTLVLVVCGLVCAVIVNEYMYAESHRKHVGLFTLVHDPLEAVASRNLK